MAFKTYYRLCVVTTAYPGKMRVIKEGTKDQMLASMRVAKQNNPKLEYVLLFDKTALVGSLVDAPKRTNSEIVAENNAQLAKARLEQIEASYVDQGVTPEKQAEALAMLQIIEKQKKRVAKQNKQITDAAKTTTRKPRAKKGATTDTHERLQATNRDE